MVNLRPLRQEEFAAYCDYFIADYAQEMVSNYGYSLADAYRGAGVGKQAFALLEQQLQTQGIQQIKLRVAYHNPRALKLYQTLGFTITGYNMAKQLQ